MISRGTVAPPGERQSEKRPEKRPEKRMECQRETGDPFSLFLSVGLRIDQVEDS